MVLLCLLLAGFSLPARAQNNPYKIDDSLYIIYQRATRWNTLPQGLLIADTLYAEATKKKDKKAQCLALTIPVHYYAAANNYDMLEQSAERLRLEARKNDYLQYYYFACTIEINKLLNNGRTLRALQKAEDMKKQALEDKHDYGIFSCIRTLGNIYRVRGNEALAAEYYQEALVYMQEHLPEQDPTTLYQALIRYYRGKKEEGYDKALELAEKGIREAKTSGSRIGVMREKCQVLYWMRRDDEFRTCYDECLRQMKQYGIGWNETARRLRVYRLVLDKDYEQALKAADSVGNKMEVYRLRREIYVKSGDYEQAYLYASVYNNYKDSLSRLVQSSDLAELTAQLDNERMKLEAKVLEYKNTKLSLANTQLALEQSQSHAELEKINAENSKLVLENRNLELARLNVEAERQKAILKEQQVVSQHQIVVLSLAALILLLFTCFLIFYLYKRRKSMAALQEKNQELTVARDRAEQSDKMKMFFIQNMSHEIRTPLNAIVGFSQMLSLPEMEFTEEEKSEFSLRIQQNSDLLTTLVDDLLDLASLESGKYTMRLEPHSCNAVCQSAIVTVEHRKPENVKLYFTSDVADDYLIVTDEKRLEQVLINFLTNAEKHTEQGEIHLHCSLSEIAGKITFSVADTGSGIPEDKADSIFERFNKLDAFKQGTGLGLNICRIIAERLNGEVRLDRNYTGGSRFLLILPLNGWELTAGNCR